MDCKKVADLMSMYMDNELNELQKAEFEEHIDRCPLCAKELNDILKILEILHDMKEVELPDDFNDTLYEKLLQAKSKDQSKGKPLFLKNRYIRALSTIAAGILTIFILKGVIFNSTFLNRIKQSESDKFEIQGRMNANSTMMAEGGTSSDDIEDVVPEDTKIEGEIFSLNSINDKEELPKEETIPSFTIAEHLDEEQESSNKCSARSYTGALTASHENGFSQIIFRENSRINVIILVIDNILNEEQIRDIAKENRAIFYISDTSMDTDINNDTNTDTNVDVDTKAYADTNTDTNSNYVVTHDLKDEEEIKKEIKESETEIYRVKEKVGFLITGNQYSQFLDALEVNVRLNSGNIYPSPIIIREDIRHELDELNMKIAEIYAKIKETNASDGEYSPIEPESLEGDKKTIERVVDEALETYEYIADVTIEIRPD